MALGGVFLVGVGHSTENKDLAVILMTISVTFYGAMFLGHLGNVIDIAPNYAGKILFTVIKCGLLIKSFVIIY